MSMFLTLLTLIVVFLFDCTLGKAINSQCNNRHIYGNDLRGMQCEKKMLWSNQANFYTNPLTSQTSDGFIFKQSSVPIPNDIPASIIKQHSVLNDIPAITTSSFKQLNVPMKIATLIDLQTCDNSLSFYFDTITATLTANSTNVSATTTAQMKSSVFNPATHATSLFLLHNKDNSEFITPSLLLPFNQDNPAISTATHIQNLLLFFVQNDLAIMISILLLP
jgi:hypothetical protein